MTEDYSFKHAQDVVQFLSSVGAKAFGALGVVWLFQGARLAELPGVAVAIGFIVVVFAWAPLFYRLFGRLPAENLRDTPGNKRWPEVGFRAFFALSFLVWAVSACAVALLVLDEVSP